MNIYLALLFAVPALANFCWIIFILWNRAYTAAQDRGLAAPAAWPSVDICVPARDEERNIERCVRSLCLQEYPGDWRVSVLDDESSDRTLEILLALQKEFPQRLHVIDGKRDPLPPGWVGKVWATTRMGKLATRDWLLFFDADTFHAPNMLREVMLRALRPVGAGEKPVGLVGGCPKLEQISLGEQFAMPTISLMYALGPIALTRNSRQMPPVPGFFHLFTRESYNAVGGYARVWDKVLDDVEMAAAINSGGFQTRIIDPSPFMGLRMYQSLREIWFGLHKSTGYIVRRSPLFAIAFLLWLLWTGALPFLAPLTPFLNAGITPCIVAAMALSAVIAMRTLMWSKDGGAWWSILLHPFLCWLVGWNCVMSALDLWRGRGVRWKNRWYDKRVKFAPEPQKTGQKTLPSGVANQ
ncbi:MAG: glycosyltransferase [Planctomycetes bacterium]|nr:glycosyltransferase [Planctomycetota bacterium]